jgi:uncharacterized protein YegJ (DUF2314 family)
MLRFLLALALLLCPAAPLPVLAQETHYLKIPNQDAAMEEAKAKARATLSHFWERLGSPGAGESGVALKVALPYGDNNTEHIWTKNVERKDGKVFGVINNVPRDVRTVRLGDRIEIAEHQISDWMYVRNGKWVGNYTLRPLLKRMPPHQAARYISKLADP